MAREQGTGGGGPVLKPRVPVPPPLIPGEHGSTGGADAYGNTPQPQGPPLVGPPGGAAAPPGVDPQVDWADVYFGSYGLPASLKAQILELGKRYGTSNPDVFFQSAQNLIRQDPWFNTVFPGFHGGVKAGLFTDETGYRSYLNQLNQQYRQYAGRDVTGGEVEAALGQGATPDLVGRQFAGDAYMKANQNDLQYLSGAFSEGQLTPGELQAYGRGTAGIDSPLYQQVKKRLDLASQRLQTVFSGRLATPNMTLGVSGLQAPGLLGTRQTPDVGA